MAPLAGGRDDVLEGNRSVHAVEAATYDRVHSEIFNWWQQRCLHDDLAAALARLPPGPRRVLDVGCGTGNIALYLHARGHHVTGVDLSAPMLARLRAKHQEDDRLRLHCADADTFLHARHASYDLIAFSSVLHHLPDYIDTLRLAASMLREPGALFITHEPLPSASAAAISTIHRAISRAGALFDEALRKLRRVRLAAIDYSVSDVHVEAGIDPDALVAALAPAGMRAVAMRQYRPERSGLAAAVNNRLLRVPPTQFALTLANAEPRPPSAAGRQVRA